MSDNLHLPQLRPVDLGNGVIISTQGVLTAGNPGVSPGSVPSNSGAATDPVTVQPPVTVVQQPVPLLAPPVGNTPTYNQTSQPVAPTNLTPLILFGLGVVYFLWKKGIL